MRVLWVSNHPNAPTGYGTQTRQAVPRIERLGHTVDIVAFYGQEGWIGEWTHPELSPRHRGAHVVYPKMFHPYGADAAAFWAERGSYDVIVSLIDGWVMPGAELAGATHWAPWFPVDSDPFPDRVREQVAFAHSPIVFSRHAEEAARAVGLSPLYVPHAIESRDYRPIDRDEARDYLELPRDSFVFGYVMANKGNPPRKAWDRHLEALAALMKAHDDVYGFIHSLHTPEMSGVPLGEWAAAYGIEGHRLRFCDRNRFVSGVYGPGDVNRVYNGIDCLVNVSNGEGWGIPIVEAQMAGTPVITGGWTAMKELTRTGWVVPAGRAERVRVGVNAWQHAAHTSAIIECMEAAYEEARDMDHERTRLAVMEYDADHVAEHYWEPALDEIDARLTVADPEPIEVVYS